VALSSSALHEEQAQQLLAAAQGERLEALYVLALATGVRQGEMLALRWRDVDLDGATLQARATVHYTKGGYLFTEPKTKYSRRRIALPEIVVEALREHRRLQLSERLALGPLWEAMDLVFPDPAGKPIYGVSMVKHQFYPLLARAGLPRIRFHDLRHTAATLLLGRHTNPKVVSEMLGHSHVSVTLGIYSHVMPHRQQHAADAMDQALGLRGNQRVHARRAETSGADKVEESGA
jgi:integrase